jgi:outer membrane protein assembly factor BamE
MPRINLSAVASPVLYVPEVVQGNFISREQKEYLKPGLSRQQVKEVLGTPLVSSVFHDQRWDYVFTIRRQGVPPQSFSLSVWFKGDLLERISGDELPSETEFVTQLVAKKAGIKVPELEAKEEDLRKYPPPVRNAEPTTSPALPLPSAYPPLEPAAR